MTFRYFFSNEHDHISGLYWIPPLYIAKEWKVSEKEVIKIINRLCATGLIQYDFESEIVFVPSMIERQVKGKISPTIYTAIERRISEYPSHPFSKLLVEKYSFEDMKPLLHEETRGIEGVSEGYLYPTVTDHVTDHVTVGGSGGNSKNGDSKPKRIYRSDIDSFTPTNDHIKTAKENGLDVNLQLRKFKNHARNKRPPYKDLDSAFDNWLLNPLAKGKNNSTNDIRYAPNFVK